MKIRIFALRNAREILREPLNLFFGVGFPLALLLLLNAIQSGVPVPLFVLSQLTPGIAVFGMSFITLFSATILAKDRGSALLQRLYTTPMTPRDFILGYTLPILPIALLQSLICYAVAVLLGLEISLNILWCVLFMIPVAILYIALGLLCGSLLTDKQVGGICGALLTNVSAWLSGIWFDLELVGGVFQKIAYALPFVHAVDMEKAVLAGDIAAALPHLWWVLIYGAGILLAAIYAFLRQMKRQ